MHKTIGILSNLLSKTCFVLVLFILYPFTAFGEKGDSSACLAQLQSHPSHEVYVSSQSISHILPNKDRPSVNRRSAKSRVQLLAERPLKDKYSRILKTASHNPHLYRLTLFVLSELEILADRPSNHSEWVHFLNGSSVEDLNHRIYEGLHAISLLNTKNIQLGFEPSAGFFADSQARKSMDLQIAHSSTGKIIAYKEVKRVYRHHSAMSALKSVVSKTLEIRPKVGDDIELSGVIYIGSPKTDDAFVMNESELYSEFQRVAWNSQSYLLRKVDEGIGHGLDSVILIDLKLERFIKIYIHGNDTRITEGDYPLESAFSFLRFN